jgi:hypothetical protein
LGHLHFPISQHRRIPEPKSPKFKFLSDTFPLTTVGQSEINSFGSLRTPSSLRVTVHDPTQFIKKG